MDTETFAIARLYDAEKVLNMQSFDCCEIYFSVAGDEHIFIGDQAYEFHPGDIVFIDSFEKHCLSKMDRAFHERVAMSIYPQYLRQLSTPQTDLSYCFTHHARPIGHRVSLNEKERRQFLYYISRLSDERNFGQDIVDQAVFMELMSFLNEVFLAHCIQEPIRKQAASKSRYAQIDEILSYINHHFTENLNIPALAAYFYLSTSYLHRIFKEATGTTINRYITDKRISRAKVLLAEGYSVAETSRLCGFGDYSNFFRAFTRIVGIPPKKYAACARK